MDHIPNEEIPDVAKTSHAVAQEAIYAGVFAFAGGLDEDVDPVAAAGDGTVTAATYPLGGMTIIDVPSMGGSAEVGRELRDWLPLCAGGERLPVRPARVT